mmetsp:Transcript_5674/g.10158  ORF Transcript_5674/g.10158 Transcript_5674/m.10158 type:complete len:150 (-) Transcript_5674:164-613(-)
MQETYGGSVSPAAMAARAAALQIFPESRDVVDCGRGEFLAPTLASLRAHEVKFTSLDSGAKAEEAAELSTILPEEATPPAVDAVGSDSAQEGDTSTTFPMWESERVMLQQTLPEEEAPPAKPQREIVTAVDDWFDLGALFGCFTQRDRS